jgi:3-dehydrosphinganine reductase
VGDDIRGIDWYGGKRVFITGGSSGIGKAAANVLARSGAHVWIAARGQGRLDEALAEIKAHGIDPDQRFGAVALDVSDREAVAAAAAEVLEGLGGLDVLINNAGIAHPAAVSETPDEVFDAMMRVNYFGTVNVTRAFWPTFMRQKSGAVCNVSSLAGVLGIYGYTAYAASKFAINGFSECLRQEAIDHNVTISLVFPGDTDTPQLAYENQFKPPETKAIAGKVKVMSAAEVAEALLRGVTKGKWHILPGFESKFAHFMSRHFPGVTRLVIDGALKKYRRQHPGTEPKP